MTLYDQSTHQKVQTQNPKQVTAMKYIAAILLIVFSNITYAQCISCDNIINGSIEAQKIEVKPWKAEKSEEYQGIYHFGCSEGESTLLLIVDNNKFYAQLKSGRWASDGSKWIDNYKNLGSVKIIKSKFYSDLTRGGFVKTIRDSKLVRHGLKVFKPWGDKWECNKKEGEIGIKSTSKLRVYFPGKYPQASLKRLNRHDLKKLSKKNLKIMRNEIFARYGYTFRAGGEMETYFKSQKWYAEGHKNVTRFLTDIEKKNIKFIRTNE